jgi:hypothetical protein
VILIVGAPQDALFGIVLVTNALIGIVQELRAKLTLDRLAVLSAPRVRVIRDGAPQDISAGELVAPRRWASRRSACSGPYRAGGTVSVPSGSWPPMSSRNGGYRSVIRPA